MTRLRLPDFRVPPSDCPVCGISHDGALATSGLHPPEDGDASLCAACGGWSIFTAIGTRRLPTSEESERLASDPATRRVRWAWEVSR